MNLNIRARVAQVATVGALVALPLFGGAMLATNTDHGPTALTPSGQTLSVQTADAATHTATPNRSQGIPPCREEDGSGQRAMCVWNDGRGDIIVNVSRKGTDDRTVVLVDRTPGR